MTHKQGCILPGYVKSCSFIVSGSCVKQRNLDPELVITENLYCTSGLFSARIPSTIFAGEASSALTIFLFRRIVGHRLFHPVSDLLPNRFNSGRALQVFIFGIGNSHLADFVEGSSRWRDARHFQ